MAQLFFINGQMKKLMQKKRDEDPKETKNEEGREVWLDDSVLSEISSDSSDEDDESEEDNEEQ